MIADISDAHIRNIIQYSDDDQELLLFSTLIESMHITLAWPFISTHSFN